MPAAKARVGRRRSTSWEHISDVAIDLFMARGFDEVSVDDVAAAPGEPPRRLTVSGELDRGAMEFMTDHPVADAV